MRRSSARGVKRSRAFQLALRFPHAPDAAASTASHPASVTIAIRPSVGWNGAGDKAVSTKQESEKFLETRLDWWNQIDLLQQIARYRNPPSVILGHRKAAPPIPHGEEAPLRRLEP
jgi:hypothetical protein